LAYASFIGHGYTSCLTCHYNPAGGGQLNDYGRALGATKVANRLFRSDAKSEEQIAEESGFLYRKPDFSWIRPALKYRGLALKTAHGTDNSETEYIHMLARASLVLKFGQRDQFLIAGNLDYAPAPRGGAVEEEPNYRSREHYIGLRPFQSVGVYVGLLDKPFGIRVPDHIAFSRTLNSLSQNDQSHGVMLQGSWLGIEAFIHYFVGNLAQEEEIRQKGFSFLAEYEWSNLSRPGFSIIRSSSLVSELSSNAIHWRLGAGGGSSLLIEFGERERALLVGNQEILKSRYGFLQGALQIARGFSILNTVEYLKINLEEEGYTLRLGPGIQYFPSQGFEIRFDFYNTRNFSKQAVSDDNWDLTGQIHLYF